MSEQITIELSVTKQVDSVKRINFGTTKVVEVDAAHVIESVLTAGIVDERIDLFVSGLITETEFILISTDQPLTVRLGAVINTPIEVEDMLLVTDSSTVIFISIPGTENANVEIIYGGKI